MGPYLKGRRLAEDNIVCQRWQELGNGGACPAKHKAVDTAIELPGLFTSQLNFLGSCILVLRAAYGAREDCLEAGLASQRVRADKAHQSCTEALP